MIRRFLTAVVLATAVAQTDAQPPIKSVPPGIQPPTLQPMTLTLRPAAPTDPVLKYQLLPEVMDQSPGNAAYLYQRSHSPEWIGYRREKGYYEKINDWLYKTPLKDLPRDQVRGYVSSALLREVDLAARREQCDWEMTERFKKEAFSMLLPDVQWFREVAALLSLRARLEMAEGNLDKAMFTIQTGLALGRHLNETPILITSLVGIAVGQVMLARMEELLQQPGAPNLYWTLTHAPRPFFDLRRPLQGEKAVMEGLFQGILGERPPRDSFAGELGLVGIRKRVAPAEPRRLTADELQVMLDDLYALSALGRDGSVASPGRFGTLGIAVKVYPAARDRLIASGRKPEEVDALPVLQVVALDALHIYRRHRDDVYKWLNLPYWEAHAGLAEASRRYEQVQSHMESIPALLDLLPAVQKVSVAGIRVDRRIAVLRGIEALRLHAAAHGGKLPNTWEEIKAVPIPLDPITGKEFTYQVAGNKATLYGPPPPGETPAGHNTVYYEITLER